MSICQFSLTLFDKHICLEYYQVSYLIYIYIYICGSNEAKISVYFSPWNLTIELQCRMAVAGPSTLVQHQELTWIDEDEE